MDERVEAVSARIRALDDAVARSTAEGSAFDTNARNARRRAGEWLGRGRAWVAERLPTRAREPLARARTESRRALDVVNDDPTGLIGAGIVLVVGYFIVWWLWTPLTWPSALVNQVVALITPSSCSAFGGSNFLSDNVCGTLLATLTLAGAILAMLGLLLVRLPLRRVLTMAFDAMPHGFGFLGAPLLATVLFTVGWAGVQYHFPTRDGIVTDGTFPAFVGLLAYAFMRYGAWMQSRAVLAFDWRETLTAYQRLGVVVVAPLVFSIVATPLLRTPVRDQATVIVGMLVGYALMAPRLGAPREAPVEERVP